MTHQLLRQQQSPLIKRLFSTLPEREIYRGGVLWDHEPRHRGWCYEYHSSRFGLYLGDLVAEGEHESGTPAGFEVELNVALAQEDTGEFDHLVPAGAKYDTHSLTAMFWRWGIYVSVRGRIR